MRWLTGKLSTTKKQDTRYVLSFKLKSFIRTTVHFITSIHKNSRFRQIILREKNKEDMM